jgi:RNA polymerase sigma-70 factor (ECF subfamily)
MPGGQFVNSVDFEVLVDACYAPLYRFAISLTRTESAAADLTQQTFYLWATRGHQLRDGAKARSWLFTTLYREFLRLHRAEWRFVPEDYEGAPAEMPVENRLAADSIDGATVLSALQQVSEVYRVPLTLFYLEELSYREIAAVLNLPTGTVMSRLSRGKAKLRKIVCEGSHVAREVTFPHPRSVPAGSFAGGRYLPGIN